MEINKKITVTLILIAVLLGATTLYVLAENKRVISQYNGLVRDVNGIIEDYNELVEIYNKLAGKDHELSVGMVYEVHSRIRIWKGTELILDEWNAGAVTNLGDNMTYYWIFGDTDMQVNNIPYTDNGTFITIGNQGTLTTSSVVLPGEWNRTAGTVEDEIQSQLNITCTFYPDNAGPYTADCIGLNTNATASANNLIMYDTFTEVTGIDETFTINVEFVVSESHS